MKFLTLTQLALCLALVQPQAALAKDVALNCSQESTLAGHGRLSIQLTDKHTDPNSGVVAIESVFWGFMFSTADMICNTRLIQLDSITELKCVGFVFGGIIQASGEIGNNGGQMKIHNIDADNAYADQTEGLTLNCKLE